MRPFVVLGTPRSRTAWLARLLSTNGWTCHHEPSVHFRTLSDLADLLRTPLTGSADSLMTLLWRDVVAMRPDTRIVVVRRPVRDVVGSFLAMGAEYSPEAVALVEKIDREAAILETLPEVLSIPFAGLAQDAVCQRLALHTIGRPVPAHYLTRLQRTNVQASMSDTETAISHNAAGFLNVFGRHLTQA